LDTLFLSDLFAFVLFLEKKGFHFLFVFKRYINYVKTQSFVLFFKQKAFLRNLIWWPAARFLDVSLKLKSKFYVEFVSKFQNNGFNAKWVVFYKNITTKKALYEKREKFEYLIQWNIIYGQSLIWSRNFKHYNKNPWP
jgi:hypothetical protein